MRQPILAPLAVPSRPIARSILDLGIDGVIHGAMDSS